MKYWIRSASLTSEARWGKIAVFVDGERTNIKK